jgi:hypothetical protein
MDVPSVVFKHSLAETITVTRRAGGMIRGPVALYANEIASGLRWIHYAEVYEKACDADLRLYYVAE